MRTRFLAPGDRLGKFDLIRQIAVGGMAELYLARTMGIEGFEKLVVVKRILPQYAENQSFVNMFLNEARLSATLHHPNITQVYDIGVEDGDYFFSMEYVHGEDLGRTVVTAMENGVPIALDSALTLIVGLCAGLHYAHEKAGPDGTPLHVVHRDVSPSNVLVSYEGGVKLVDFGIARAGSQPSQTKGGLKGKIAYMSPEQCRGKTALDRRSDVFSVGTMLYELTTGQLPFTDETEYGVLNQIVNTDAPPPSTIVPTYPPALEAIVMKALARNVEERYTSAQELQGQLEDFAHENRLRVSPLVLARLMSTLFPARLEEWDHARAQGAFFVEQHVVRTLIESGKTSDNTNVAGKLVVTPASDEETTAVTELVPMEDTDIGAAPQKPEPAPPRLPVPPAPPPRLHSPRAATPIPGGVPIMPAGGGVLVSNRSEDVDSAPVLASPSIDVTERVRVPTPLPIRIEDVVDAPRPKKSRLPLVLGMLAVLAAAAGIAVVTLGGAKDAKTATPVASPRPEAKQQPVATEPAEPVEPVAVEPAVVEPVAVEPITRPAAAVKPAEPAPADPVIAPSVPTAKPKQPPRPKPPAKIRSTKKPAEVATPPPKVEPKPKKEPAWNDDSPFMPVRTEKR